VQGTKAEIQESISFALLTLKMTGTIAIDG
jgi:hypothetical protein